MNFLCCCAQTLPSKCSNKALDFRLSDCLSCRCRLLTTHSPSYTNIIIIIIIIIIVTSTIYQKYYVYQRIRVELLSYHATMYMYDSTTQYLLLFYNILNQEDISRGYITSKLQCIYVMFVFLRVLYYLFVGAYYKRK